jgi:hypothetical protein
MQRRPLINVFMCILLALTALFVGSSVSASAATPVATQSSTPAGWELVRPGDAFAAAPATFRSRANGRYVSAELGYGGGNYAMLRARARAIGPWERYDLRQTGAGAWSIRSRANGRYVSAELGYGGGNYAMLRARATAIGPWERYDLYRNNRTGAWSIRSRANGRYVSAELGYGGGSNATLRARAGGVGPWEQFNIS